MACVATVDYAQTGDRGQDLGRIKNFARIHNSRRNDPGRLRRLNHLCVLQEEGRTTEFSRCAGRGCTRSNAADRSTWRSAAAEATKGASIGELTEVGRTVVAIIGNAQRASDPLGPVASVRHASAGLKA